MPTPGRSEENHPIQKEIPKHELQQLVKTEVLKCFRNCIKDDTCWSLFLNNNFDTPTARPMNHHGRKAQLETTTSACRPEVRIQDMDQHGGNKGVEYVAQEATEHCAPLTPTLRSLEQKMGPKHAKPRDLDETRPNGLNRKGISNHKTRHCE